MTLALGLLVGGCSADVALFRADWNWWSNNAPAPGSARTAAPAEGLVGPDGSCPADEGGARGVALGMTECELVRAAGPTDSIEIGANERGERTAVLTYPRGERAGIYRFTSGLLVSIERVAEAPPPRPQRPARRSQQQQRSSATR